MYPPDNLRRMEVLAYYARESWRNSSVLSSFLKVLVQDRLRIFSGKLLKTVSDARLKDCCPILLVIPVVLASLSWLDERSWRAGSYLTASSDRYCGCWYCTTLCVMSATLYLILCSTGSQWSSFSTGVMLSYFLAPATTRAREFWTRCSFLMFAADAPYSSELQ